MPIEIIDTLEPKNDGVFPVVDVSDVSGAHQVFADTAARDAFPAGKLTVGMTCYVVDVATEYRLSTIDPLVWVEGGSGTGVGGGLVSGGQLTINANPALFDLSAGSAYINGSLVSWSAFTAQTVTNLATATVTHVFISSGGAITQQTVPPTPTQRRSAQYIGQLGHTNLTSIATAVNNPDVWLAPDAQLRDFLRCIGIYSCSGNVASANGANLSINISAGELFGSGVNFANSTTDPNTIAFGALTSPTIRMRTQTGEGASSSFVDVANYDVGGTITPMPTNKFQVMRIYRLTSGNIVAQYGQSFYNSIALAFDGYRSEGFVPFTNVTSVGALIGVLIVQQGATDLSDSSSARFVVSSGLGAGGGSGAGASWGDITGTIADQTDLTPTAIGAVALDGATIHTPNAVVIDFSAQPQNILAADDDVTIDVVNEATGTSASLVIENTTLGAIAISDVFGCRWLGTLGEPTTLAASKSMRIAFAVDDQGVVDAAYAVEA